MTPARLGALVVLTLIAIAVAMILQRRRPDPPSAPSYRSPVQLDRSDFVAGEGRLLIALFASQNCDSCPVAWAAIEGAMQGSLGERVDVQRIDVQDDPAGLHARYKIDGVPTTVVADAEGVVAQAFFGPVTENDVTIAVEQALAQ